MTQVLKKVSGRRKPTGVVINDRYKTVRWRAGGDGEGEDDEYIVECLVRTSLLNSEVEALIEAEAKSEAELWETVAPYVKKWNIFAVDEDGDVCEVLPPAEGGGASFQFAPRQLSRAIVGALIMEPFEPVDPKSLKTVESTDDPSSAN